MTDYYYQPPPLRSIETTIDIDETQFRQLGTGMRENVIFMVSRVERTPKPDMHQGHEWTYRVTLKSIGTTERLK